MSDITKQWYKDYKKRYDENIHLIETSEEECLRAITGLPVSQAVWRYLKIHGAIERMGGFANFSHYVNKCLSPITSHSRMQLMLLRALAISHVSAKMMK